MTTNHLVKETEEFVKSKMYGLPPSHNFAHVDRVRHIALNLASKLGGDILVIELAALLHDVGLPEELDRGGDHAEISAQIAKEFLSGKLSSEKLDKVIDAVYCHRYSNGRKPKYLEGLIIQDADRLDALGAIGIARVFASAKANIRFFYNPDDPFHETPRKLDDKTYALDHFYSKLLSLDETLNTDLAKKEARRRIEFMKRFLDELKIELE